MGRRRLTPFDAAFILLDSYLILKSPWPVKNEASKTRSLKIAFVVNADHLRRLATVLGEASKQLEYTVGFSDGTSVHYNDVDDIIKLPNSNEHSIISLIAGTPEAGNQTAFVTLRQSDPES